MTCCAAAAVIVAGFNGIGGHTGSTTRDTALGVIADDDVGYGGDVRIGRRGLGYGCGAVAWAGECCLAGHGIAVG